MGKRKSASKASSKAAEADSYLHPEAKLPLRPDVGTQPQFRKKKPPQRYRYDSSLAPALEWDGQNPAREVGEQAIAEVMEQATIARKAAITARENASAALESGKNDLLEQPGLEAIQAAATDAERAATAIQEAAERLRALGRPFLNWSGKAERLSFDVPTLPLFVHERLSTKAIIDTLTGHVKDKQKTMFDLFGDPAHPVADQVLRAYEYQDRWVNRMILGDSLVVMNSLLRYEGLGGQVQMIYMDPPYGVKFGSNFQPFVRKRDVRNGDDDDFTREPEMVQAYRDTWELGLHTYLGYMRDRLMLARDLLTPSGSLFVQISDDNLHHVTELLDEVFGPEHRVAIIAFKKTGFASDQGVSTTHDFILWYAKNKKEARIRPVFGNRPLTNDELGFFDQIELADGTRRPLTPAEKKLGERVRELGKPFSRNPMVSPGWQDSLGYPVEFEGRIYRPPSNRHWATHPEGMQRLREARRLAVKGNTLRYVRYFDDFSLQPIGTVWNDTGVGGFVGDDRLYVVQTDTRAIQRCLLMTTSPGDLVIDPTCGSGTTAYVAEQLGRRWITCDVSRVPLALARQRLLTSTFPWHKLNDEDRGPVGGFVYKRKQNKNGEEIGGVVPHVTLKSIANNEPPKEEVIVDRAEKIDSITRVTGPFTFEATIPTPVDFDGDGQEDSGASAVDRGSFTDRMLEVLRRSPLLRLDGNRTVKLANIRSPAKTLSLSAEAIVVNGTDKPVAFVFGPENGAISEQLVYHAAREATAKSYTHLYVVGFAIQANARQMIDQCEAAVGVAATYVQATPDLLMGDLLKNMRSSQIFSVCGLPEVKLRKVKGAKGAATEYEVELVGLDVFDPVTMESEHRAGNDVPAWFLDADYNDLCFHVSQAFFPRTSAWDNLKKAIKGDYDADVWDHLAGTVSAPFTAGEHGQIAVKVIDDRGNELVVVKKLSEVENGGKAKR
jgi:adenine-specific DNA-methyltransferase